MEIAKADVFIDSDGKVVSGNSPKAAFQVAFKGVALDPAAAARYKIKGDGSDKAEETAARDQGDVEQSEEIAPESLKADEPSAVKHSAKKTSSAKK